jgi:acetolactate synthase-1/2/3 large subunit
MSRPNERTGGQILVDQLVIQGVEHVFCVPGESYLAVLDALHDAPIDVTVCRQEGGATMMADAAGRLTGRPGIVFVTRGPGATNAAPGIHIAEHDSTPLILFIGQIGRRMRGRGAFQEMDFKAFFGSTAKLVIEVDDPSRLPEVVSRAFHVALQGRPGPVVVALPEDMLTQTAHARDGKRVEAAYASPGPVEMAALQKLLSTAHTPLAILGGSGWTRDAVDTFRRFAERFDLPVATSFRRAPLFAATHANYAGEIGIGPNPKLKAHIAAADLLLVVGGRFSEIPSQGFTLLDVPNPRQMLVHVHPGAEELGRVYNPALGILASPQGFCAALETLEAPAASPWSAWRAQAHADYLGWSEEPPPAASAFDYGAAMVWLRAHLPPDAIVTTGAGNYTIWPQRFLRFRQFATQLAPVSGSMGYGLPAAVAAKRLNPDKTVVCFAGDGCFLMNGQEFATAVLYDLAIIVIVIDNGMYGTIRMHQERHYPGRISATNLRNPDFAALARAYGGHGETIEHTGAFAGAFERAVASGKPAIVHVKVDPDDITPTTTLTAIRDKALQQV